MMNKGHTSFFALSILLSTSVYAIDPVVYGKDDRIEVHEAPEIVQELARSTAIQIENKNILPSTVASGFSTISAQSLAKFVEVKIKDKETENQCNAIDNQTTCSPNHQSLGVDKVIKICSEERFATQPSAGNCSGFLIAPDLILTAGHCTSDPKDCSNYSWVFDYKVEKETGKIPTNIPAANIYKCKQIVSSSLLTPIKIDFGIILLDRPVTDRSPLDLRLSGKIANNQEIFVIGGPSGLPTKVTPGANVRDNSNLYQFSANLDTYGGNSGSAVFNASTMQIEGILVQGEKDYTLDTDKNCIRTNYCKDDECMGEKISRLSSLNEIKIYKALFRAVETNQLENLKELLSLNTYIDFRLKNGVTPLMKATSMQNIDAMELLIKNGANPNTVDAQGNTAAHYLAKNLDQKSGDILNLLIISKADLNKKNLNGETPLMIAQKAKNSQGTSILKRMGAN